MALRSLVHALTMPIFYLAAHQDSCVTVRGASYAPNADAEKSPAEKALAAAHKIWAKRLPKDQEKLWDWLAKKSTEDLLSLLAYCTTLTINAVKSKCGIGVSSGQIDHSHELADALKLDMSNWWQPTAETYLSRVSKDQIIEALRQADKIRPYDVANMKKPQLAAHAAKQLAESGWLPAILRAKETA
jgi:ParB family transcriptional regulator, chromosome partitioning protein